MSDAIRTGDTVFDKDGGQWTVASHEYDKVIAKSGKRRKTFKLRSLECIDLDDGLWQETESRKAPAWAAEGW